MSETFKKIEMRTIKNNDGDLIEQGFREAEMEWMEKIESIKSYIMDEMQKRAFEHEQIKIDFTGIAEEEDICFAVEDLGYEFIEAIGEEEGIFWVYKE